MSRMFQRLARDERGASVIEMALVLPFFGAMVIGVTDISRAYSTKLQLEQAAQRAVEKVQQYQTTSSTYDTLQGEAATAAGVSTGNVAVDYWLECNGTRQSDYDTVCPSNQTYGRWVTVDITGTYTPMFSSSRWPGSNTDGTYTIHGKAGIRTQ
jgi:Flp pilus assembly protein TadG